MASPTPVETSSRGARRRARSRARLIAAARQVMGERGVDAATIAEIAEAADLGFGTFYNHFASKEEVLEAVVAEDMTRLGDAIDAQIASVADPAEAFAIAMRHTVRSALRDPVWGWFVVRVGRAREQLASAMSRRGLRDIRRGIACGRFQVADTTSALIGIGGVIVAMMEALLRNELDDADQECAAQALRILGVAPEVADDIARRPLPETPR